MHGFAGFGAREITPLTFIVQGYILKTGAMDVFEHMALDEIMGLNPMDGFTVRFYNWKGGGVTFGYAQNWNEVKRQIPAPQHSFAARRPTGGGVVYHGADLTFSCVFKSPVKFSATDIYGKLHTAVNSGLAQRGINAGLCGKEGSDYKPSVNNTASACFTNPVNSDIMQNGSKILGGALRRFGNSVLYQGSLLFDGVRNRAGEFELCILKSLASLQGIKWKNIDVNILMPEVNKLAAEKYRAQEYLEKF